MRTGVRVRVSVQTEVVVSPTLLVVDLLVVARASVQTDFVVPSCVSCVGEPFDDADVRVLLLVHEQVVLRVATQSAQNE